MQSQTRTTATSVVSDRYSREESASHDSSTKLPAKVQSQVGAIVRRVRDSYPKSIVPSAEHHDGHVVSASSSHEAATDIINSDVEMSDADDAHSDVQTDVDIPDAAGETFPDDGSQGFSEHASLRVRRSRASSSTSLPSLVESSLSSSSDESSVATSAAAVAGQEYALPGLEDEESDEDDSMEQSSTSSQRSSDSDSEDDAVQHAKNIVSSRSSSISPNESSGLSLGDMILRRWGNQPNHNAIQSWLNDRSDDRMMDINFGGATATRI